MESLRSAGDRMWKLRDTTEQTFDAASKRVTETTGEGSDRTNRFQVAMQLVGHAFSMPRTFLTPQFAFSWIDSCSDFRQHRFGLLEENISCYPHSSIGNIVMASTAEKRCSQLRLS
jgi:hypothetical protein